MLEVQQSDAICLSGSTNVCTDGLIGVLQSRPIRQNRHDSRSTCVEAFRDFQCRDRVDLRDLS